jgi:hypothetical protein
MLRLFLLFLLIAVVPAAAKAEQASRLQTLLESRLALPDSISGGSPAVTVQAVGDGFRFTITDLRLMLRHGRVLHADSASGTLTLRADGDIDLTAALSKRLTLYDSEGLRAGDLTAGRHMLTARLSADLQQVKALDLSWQDLQFTAADLRSVLSIEKLTFRVSPDSVSRSHWSGTVDAAMAGLRRLDETGRTTLTIAAAGQTWKISRLDMVQFGLLLNWQPQGDSPDKGSNRGPDTQPSLDRLAARLAGGFWLEGLKHQPSEAMSLSTDRVSLDFDLQELDRPSAKGQITVRHRNARISGAGTNALAYDRILPRNAELQLTVSDIPPGILLAWLTGYRPAEGADMRSALGTAGAQVNMTRLDLTGELAGLSGTGRLAFERQSPRRPIGELNLLARGLDSVTAALAADAMAMPALSFLLFSLQSLGKPESGPDGERNLRFQVTVQPDGRALINGRDMGLRLP